MGNIIIFAKLMSGLQLELLGSTPKKIYEFILSAKEPSGVLGQALGQLIKQSFNSAEHFPFLMHRVSWFQQPFVDYSHLLLKIFRIFKSSTPQSCKVMYNMLIEAFFKPSSHLHALDCFTHIFSEMFDKRPLVQALRDSYPHKLCPLEMHQLYLGNLIQLSRTFKNYRTDFLQIIVENLAKFDTEIMAADQWVHQPFPIDQRIIQLRQTPPKLEVAQKLDILLPQLMVYLMELEKDEAILNEIFLVFQNKLLPIKTTKMVQLVVFLVAEGSKARAKTFVQFLLSNIFENNKERNWYRIFTQSNFYLFSYISRSTQLSDLSKLKTLAYLVQELTARLQEIEPTEINQTVKLKEFMQKHESLLTILQTIVLIKLTSSSISFQNYSQSYNQLILECQKKLHFDYFFHEQILKRMGFESRSNIRIKFSNKFLPSTLPHTSELVDQMMRMERGEGASSQLKQYEPAPKKMHKGDTPISYCSETVV